MLPRRDYPYGCPGGCRRRFKSKRAQSAHTRISHKPKETPERLLPSLHQIEEAFGEPARHWAGRCYTLAAYIIDHGLCKGRAVYGHWTGPIHHRSLFANKREVGFCQHGWVVLPDGRILDPTRWAFEGNPPYLYVGPNDHYDEGGNKWRMAHVGPPPSDEDEAFGSGVHYLDDLDDLAWNQVVVLLKIRHEIPRTITTTQAAWLAHLDPVLFGDHALAVYRSLKANHLGAFIPIDNQHAILGGGVQA